MFWFFLKPPALFLTVSWRWTRWAWWTPVTVRWWSAAARWGAACTFFLFLFWSRWFYCFDWWSTPLLSHSASNGLLNFVLIFLFIFPWRRRWRTAWWLNLYWFLFVVFVRFSTTWRILPSLARIASLFIRLAPSFASSTIPVTWWTRTTGRPFAWVTWPPPACTLCHWLLIEIFRINFKTLWFEKAILRRCVSGNIWDVGFSYLFWNQPQLRLLLCL